MAIAYPDNSAALTRGRSVPIELGDLYSAAPEHDEAFSHTEAPYTDVSVGIIKDEDSISEARKLVGREYTKFGYVRSDQLTDEGYINSALDPHVEDSTYFAVTKNGKTAATARLIAKEDISLFPAFTEFGINPLDVAPSQDASIYREVSALAKDSEVDGHRSDVLSLYAQMMKESINNDVRYWLMSVDSKLSHKLKMLFGKKSFERLGETQFVMGSDTDPLVLDIHKSLSLLDRRFPPLPRHIKQIFVEGLKGVDPSKVDDKIRHTLARHGILGEEAAREAKKGDRLERIATLGLVGYTLARAGVIPATSLDEDGVNPAVFLGLDVVTVPTYVRGLRMAGSQESSKRRAASGAVMAGVSFLAPYVYVAAEAHDSSALPEAFGIFGGMLAGAAAVKKTVAYRAQSSGYTPRHAKA